MTYLQIFDRNVAEELVKSFKGREVGPYQLIVINNIEYMIDEITEEYNLCKEERENVKQYLAANWVDVNIDEEDIQRQLKYLASDFIEEERQYEEEEGE